VTGIHWVIAGGESGPNARPVKPEWAVAVKDQCVAQKVQGRSEDVWETEKDTPSVHRKRSDSLCQVADIRHAEELRGLGYKTRQWGFRRSHCRDKIIRWDEFCLHLYRSDWMDALCVRENETIVRDERRVSHKFHGDWEAELEALRRSSMSDECAIVELYCRRLRRISTKLVWAVTYTPISHPVKDRSWFYLIYATTHVKGLQEFHAIEDKALKHYGEIRQEAIYEDREGGSG
jgi:hypothetical protein